LPSCQRHQRKALRQRRAKPGKVPPNENPGGQPQCFTDAASCWTLNPDVTFSAFSNGDTTAATVADYAGYAAAGQPIGTAVGACGWCGLGSAQCAAGAGDALINTARRRIMRPQRERRKI
jgi:hypothetical protein